MIARYFALGLLGIVIGLLAEPRHAVAQTPAKDAAARAKVLESAERRRDV